ncbi:MAG TPA: glycosyltransferase family 39 protein [Acetobacteraceae bacterium]|nr:glycosyltransferase family 39 protein [Acetobacteraceae bacterium]
MNLSFSSITPTRLRAVHYGLLMVMCLALFGPGRDRLPPIDRDESRYMQATSQMLESGNYVDVRFQDQPRYLQPAGIYWLEAASVSLLSSPEAKEPWAYRVPSLIGATVAVLLTAYVGSALFGPSAGLVSALLLACSVLLGIEARMATIDATLLAAIMAAQAALLRVFLDREAGAPPRRWLAACYWAALGVGLMLKGPVILLVSWGTLLGLFAAERRVGWWRRLYPAWGIPLMLLIVLPWCVAIWVVSNGSFFVHSVVGNFLGKVASGQQNHGLPPGYHLLAFALAFWPGSLLAVLAIPYTWAQRRSPPVRFLLAWIVPTWVVFEAVATKLPHYVLPTYPAIACLTAAAALAPVPWRFGRVWRSVAWICGILWAVISLGLAVTGPVLLWWVQSTIQVFPVLAGLAAAALAVGMLVASARRQPGRALAAAGLASLLVAVSSYGFVLPDLQAMWLSPRIAAAVRAVRPCPDSVVASASYSEPSLVFLVGKDTQLVKAGDAADFLLAHQSCGLALIGRADAAAFLARMTAGDVTPRPLAKVSGINYSANGRRLDLTLYAGPRIVK